MLSFIFNKKDEHLAKWELEKVLLEFQVVAEASEYVIIQADNESSLITDVDLLQSKLASIKRIGVVEEYVDEHEIVDAIVNNFYEDKLTIASYSIGVDAITKKSLSQDIVSILRTSFKKIDDRCNNKPLTSKQFHSLAEVVEIQLLQNEYTLYAGQTLTSTNPQEFKSLDEDRPARTFTHGTSPRLARSMVNILGLNDSSRVVDPFCGTGTFLLELMRQGHQVVGIDHEAELLDQAEENAEWLNEQLEEQKIVELVEDNAQDAQFEADACVFEPYMGPFLKDTPNKRKAESIIFELENLYSEVFENLYNNLSKNAPVVCILPSLPHRDGVAHVHIPSIFKDKFMLQKSEYFESENPFEFKSMSGSRLIRNIYVLQRADESFSY